MPTQHKASGDLAEDIHIDPRVRAAASVKAEQMKYIQEANHSSKGLGTRQTDLDSPVTSVEEPVDLTSVKWENEALRHQVTALKNVLKERESSLKQKAEQEQRLEEEIAAKDAKIKADAKLIQQLQSRLETQTDESSHTD